MADEAGIDKDTGLHRTGLEDYLKVIYPKIKRMAEEFKRFPEQYQTNINALKMQNDTFKSEIDFLETEYNKLN